MRLQQASALTLSLVNITATRSRRTVPQSFSNFKVNPISNAFGCSTIMPLSIENIKNQSSDAKNSAKPMDWISLNSEKSEMQLVKVCEVEWVETSQAGGVHRKMIERLGGEVARATTVVKFDPDQAFPRHSHAGGEEFLVLEGVWRDDYGSFSKYSYIRNYIGSGHTPSIGPEGCIILVKLRQMSLLSENEPEHRNWPELTPAKIWAIGEPYSSDKAKRLALFSSELEKTAVHVWSNNSSITLEIPANGMEIFVVDGVFSSDLGIHDKWSWCRIPNDSNANIKFEVKTQDAETYVWTKEGHLASDEVGV